MNGDEIVNGGGTSGLERPKAERNLPESERRLATLLSNLPGMAYRCKNDRDWTMEFVSDGCEALTGYKASGLVGNFARSFNSLIHPDDRDRIRGEVQNAVSRRNPYRLTYRIIAADGREKWVWEQGVGLFSGNGLEALEGFITDVTDGRDAEARLRRQVERFRAIIDNTDAGYFRIGMGGCYEEVNPAWLRMHGFSRKEEIIGRHFSIVQPPEDAAQARDLAAALMRGEAVNSGEFSRLRRDGTTGYHSFSANPVFDGEKVVGIEGFLVDISEKKTAERERLQRDQQYRALFDTMNEGVAVHQLICSDGVPQNYRLLAVNDRYEQILGVKREQVENKLATEAYGTEAPPYLKEFASVVQTGSACRFETYFPPLQKHFVISVAPMGDDLFASIFSDATEEKKTALHYRLVSENTGDVIWLFDLADGRCVYLSPSVKKMRGLSPEEGMAQSLEEAMPPDTYRMVMAELQRRTAALECGDESARIGTNEINFLRRDGTTVDTETVTTLLADERGMVRHVVGVSRDITERKRTEGALRESERQLLESQRVAGLGSYTLDIPAGFWKSSVVLDEVFGIDGDFVRSIEGWTSLVHPEWRERMANYFAVNVLKKRGRFDKEYKIVRHNDGKERWVHGQGELEFDAQGRPIRMLGTILDITERKLEQEEKSKLEAQFHQAQKMESVGRLAGGVAHDFNNLLTVINGYSLMLLAQLGTGDPLRDSIEEIHRAGERAAGLTSQLLAFSRKQVLEPRKLDVNRVVKEMRPMLQRLVGEDVEVHFALEAKNGMIHADPHQLEQVLMNLVVNARDALPGAGKVLVETANVEWDESSARAHPEARVGRYVKLAVTDTGVGMDEDTKSRIFEPFFTTKGIGKGTGLGLSTVQGIVAQSGGYIEVYSEPGQGAKFNIYLPALAEAAADDVKSTAVPVQGGRETVLVVEDQAEVRKYAVAVLKGYGYRAIPAESADDALLFCERERIDLVLTDVVMPNVSGIELAGRLETLYPDVKVLFMSAHSDDVIEPRGILKEGAKFIQKPFSPEALAGKIRAVLGPPGPAARILVADDDSGVRHFLRKVLEQGGYSVTEAADGKQALQQVLAGHVDLVITDLVMPEGEGLDTIRTIRRRVPDTGIIAISGAFGGQFLRPAQLLGADAVLSKPVSAELLLTNVAAVLKLRD
jgi:PAS domain S-box-containing protein